MRLGSGRQVGQGTRNGGARNVRSTPRIGSDGVGGTSCRELRPGGSPAHLSIARSLIARACSGRLFFFRAGLCPLLLPFFLGENSTGKRGPSTDWPCSAPLSWTRCALFPLASLGKGRPTPDFVCGSPLSFSAGLREAYAQPALLGGTTAGLFG